MLTVGACGTIASTPLDDKPNTYLYSCLGNIFGIGGALVCSVVKVDTQSFISFLNIQTVKQKRKVTHVSK